MNTIIPIRRVKGYDLVIQGYSNASHSIRQLVAAILACLSYLIAAGSDAKH